MNETEYRTRGDWNELKGKMKQQYGNLTESSILQRPGFWRVN
ncbi:CsbD family protein [Pontibacter russatus]|nr:CsbD family protein [Pontibacter russatus]